MADDSNVRLIDEVIGLIKGGDVSGAKGRFRELLTSIKLMGYDEWSEEYTKKVEEFGELFEDEKLRGCAGEFVEELDRQLEEGRAESFYHVKVEILWNLDDHKKALLSVDEALGQYPENPEFLNTKAQILQNLGHNGEALSEINKALGKKADYPIYLNTQAIILKNLGHNDDALSEINKALGKKPDYPTYLNTKAIILQNLGHNDEALSEINKALGKKVDYPIYLNTKAQILKNLGHNDEALSEINKALGKEEHPASFNTKAQILQNLGHNDEALSEINKALGKEPDDPIYLGNKSYIHLTRGEYDEALNAVNAALGKKPEDANLLSLRTSIKYAKVLKERGELLEKEGREKLEEQQKGFEDKIEKLRDDFKNELNDQRIRMVELLGIFTAILAFVVVGKDLVLNYTFWQTLLLLPSFALALSIFVIAIHYLIQNDDKKFYYVFGFIVLFVILILVGAYIYGFANDTPAKSAGDSAVGNTAIPFNNPTKNQIPNHAASNSPLDSNSSGN